MIYIQNFIWGVVKEIPLLVIFFWILDGLVERKKINRTNAVFNKLLLFALVFILSMTVEDIFNIKYIYDNDYIINLDMNNVFIKQLNDVINCNVKSIIEMIGNIFLFMPFGFLISYFMWGEKEKLAKVILVGAGVSLIIETTQVLFGRVFDINDIILNVCGILMGYYFFSYTNQIIIPFHGYDLDCKYIVGKIKLKHFKIIISILIYIRMII